MDEMLRAEEAGAQQGERKVVMDVRDITKSLPLGRERIEILRGISFQIYSGEFVSIMGPSGSGKSTLLGIIAGLDNPTSGQVLIDGVDITRMSEARLAEVRNSKIGMVFQAFNLIPTLTASENVELAMVPLKGPKAERRRRAAELLGAVGLSERTRHLPSLLSGGEQQRVAIARAMANNPRVILADEPTGNLDSRSSEEIGTILRSLAAEQGVTVILVTHADNVAGWAHRRLAMRDGQLSDRADSEWRAPMAPITEAPAMEGPATEVPAVEAPAPAPQTLSAETLAAETLAAESAPDPAGG